MNTERADRAAQAAACEILWSKPELSDAETIEAFKMLVARVVISRPALRVPFQAILACLEAAMRA